MNKIPLKLISNSLLYIEKEQKKLNNISDSIENRAYATTKYMVSFIENLYSKKNEWSSYVTDSIIIREKDLSHREYSSFFKYCKDNILRELCIKGIKAPKIFSHSFAFYGNTYLHLPFNVFKDLIENRKPLYDELLDNNKEIGISIHSSEDLKLAEINNIDYCIYGNIYETKCKEGLMGKGADSLKRLVSSTSLPIYAIGGIDSKKGEELYKCGAKGVCIMSSIYKK